MKKHTILFLAANPAGTDRLALDREARAIQVELERSGFRDRFEFVTRWAAEPLDLLRELRKLKPTVVHFSGHGAPNAAGTLRLGPAPRRDVVEPGHNDGEPRHGLFFHGPDGCPQLVSTAALEETFGAAGASVKLVVFNACYSDVQAEALLAHVDCVVGMNASIHDDGARSFAIGFYGGLGERESVAAAYKQGCAAISLEGLSDGDHPRLKVRPGIDANQLTPAAVFSPEPSLMKRSFIISGPGFVVLSILAYAAFGGRPDVHDDLQIDDVIIRCAKPIVADEPSDVGSVSDDRSRGSGSEAPTPSRHIFLDVRVRNSGSSTINLTKATLRVVREEAEASYPASSYEPSAVYKISSPKFISLKGGLSHLVWKPGELADRSRLSEESVPVAHVLRPGEVDNFLVEVNTAPELFFRLILTYNGHLTATSRELSGRASDSGIHPGPSRANS